MSWQQYVTYFRFDVCIFELDLNELYDNTEKEKEASQGVIKGNKSNRVWHYFSHISVVLFYQRISLLNFCFHVTKEKIENNATLK